MTEILKEDEINEIKSLDPKKKSVKKVFRKYSQETDIIKPEKKPSVLLKFPKKTEDFFEEISIWTLKYKNELILTILLVLILIFLILIFIPKMPTASFIDKADDSFIKGYVYFDDNYLGSTTGSDFKIIPKSYCQDKHILRLESERGSYEWETYPVDCQSKKIIFYIQHEKAVPSKNIIFNFLDSSGSFYVTGKLYFDNVSIGYVEREISILRANCSNITQIRIESKDFFNEWINDKSACKSSPEIRFKTNTSSI